MSDEKPAAKTAEKKPAAPHTEALAAAIDHGAHLTGIEKVFHELEVGFVHALAGAKDEAHHAIETAETEIVKFHPNLSHLGREVELAKARILAALHRK